MPNVRVQYSLGTLLMIVITLGACMGLLKTYMDNQALRKTIAEQHEQLGTLSVDDPTKAYIRVMKTDVPLIQRYNMYIPESGDYLFIVQSTGIPDYEEPRLSETRETIRKGFYQFDIVIQTEGNWDNLVMRTMLTSKQYSGVPFERTRKYGWGWLDVHNIDIAIEAGPLTPEAVNLSKPVQLFKLFEKGDNVQITLTLEKAPDNKKK